MKRRNNKEDIFKKDIQEEKEIYERLNDENYLEFIESKKDITKGE